MAHVDNSAFYDAQNRYLADHTDKAAWDKMFLDVLNCMYSCARKELARTAGMRDIDDRVMDSVTYLMGRYKRDPHFKIARLEYMCRMTVYSFIHRPSQIRKEREIDIDTVANARNSGAYNPDFITDIEKRSEEEYLLRFAATDSPAFARVGLMPNADRYEQKEFDFGA